MKQAQSGEKAGSAAASTDKGGFPAWHTQVLAEVERGLQTSLHLGLSADEAARRLAQHGANELPPGKTDSLFLVFARQFQSPLIYILVLASIAVFAMGDTSDGAVILFVLFFNACMGTIQEGRARQTLQALKKFTETSALVVRDGKEVIIEARDLVPGDVVVLQEGEKVPADARVVELRSLAVEEAALTGESVPAHKIDAAIRNPAIQIAEQRNMVFRGTHVVAGNGKAIAVATGSATVMGKISKAVLEVDTEIPLKKDIRHLSKIIVLVVLSVGAVLFAIGLLGGRPMQEMFRTVVALSVAIIPEGLPIVLTLVLATGVARMARRNALVKKLQAVEALGQAAVIAVDKTGTLTRNEMIIREVVTQGMRFEIGGVGYEPTGEIRLKGGVIDPSNHPELLRAGKIASFCANAKVAYLKDSGRWHVAGDPTEAALLVFGEKIGFHKDELERESPLIYEVPFDYRLKYHCTAHRVDGAEYLAVVGAPESLFGLCESVVKKNGNAQFGRIERAAVEKTFRDMSTRGLRVVAFAFRELPMKKRSATQASAVTGLTLGGFYGMEDSLRPEVPEAMEQARRAGIRVLMITGDYPLTGRAIAEKADIWREGDMVLTGAELDRMSEDEFSGALERTSVFARVSPEHKMKIIQGFRRRGDIVAMTGDGVNDAPSLVAADLGVAMGKIGTEVAKEAADIVLLDDNFGSIVGAVEEGRSIYITVKKVVLYLFSTSAGEMLTIAAALVMGYPLPILPSQIVWLNLVTDGFLDVALAMEPKEKGLLEKTFSRPSRYFIDKAFVTRIAVMALPMIIGTLILFSRIYETDLQKAWTLSLTTLAIFQWFNAWNCRSENKSMFQMNPFSNKFLVAALFVVIGLQMLAVYHPFMQGILKTVPLAFTDWLWAAAVALSIIAAEEIRKAFSRMKKQEKKDS